MTTETKPLTREDAEQMTAFTGAPDCIVISRARVLALLDERDAFRNALDEALTAIDAVESEPGAGTIFRLGWTRALKLLRAEPAAAAETWAATRQRLEDERDALRAALIARHGGEPVALLSELDAARSELAANAELLRAANARTDEMSERLALVETTSVKSFKALLEQRDAANARAEALKAECERYLGNIEERQKELSRAVDRVLLAERERDKAVNDRGCTNVEFSRVRDTCEELRVDAVKFRADRDSALATTAMIRALSQGLDEHNWECPEMRQGAGNGPCDCDAAKLHAASASPDTAVRAFLDGVRAEERAKCDVEWEQATAFASQPKTPSMREIIAAHDAKVAASARAAALREAVRRVEVCSETAYGEVTPQAKVFGSALLDLASDIEKRAAQPATSARVGSICDDPLDPSSVHEPATSAAPAVAETCKTCGGTRWFRHSPGCLGCGGRDVVPCPDCGWTGVRT